MRSVAWGLLQRTARRTSLVPPGAIVKRIAHHKSTPLLTSSLPSRSTQRAQHTEASSSRPRHIADEPQPNTQEQFFAYLNGAQPALSFGLPIDCTRIDAYLHLKETAPYTLANLSDEALAQLCMQAGVKRLGGIVGSLIDELEGKSPDEIGLDEQSGILSEVPLQLRDARTVKVGGIFRATPGSQRRLNAVQALLMGTSRKQKGRSEYNDEDEGGVGFVESLVSSSLLERAYSMLLNDFQQIKAEQGQPNTDSPLPDNLDIRVARRLIRTIAVSGNVKLEPILADLIRHVKRYEAEGVAFPQAMEGCYLLEYYLGLDEDAVVNTFGRPPSPEMPQTMQAAYCILEDMTASDPDMVSDILVDAASKDGQQYSDHLIFNNVPQLEATKQRLTFTLRMVVFNVLLKKSRFNMLQERLQALIDDVQQTSKRFQVKSTRRFYRKAIATSINVALGLKIAYPLAFTIAKRFPEVWPLDLELEGSGALLKALTECALREGRLDDLLAIIEDVLTETRPPRDQLAPAAFYVGPEALISIIRRQAEYSRSDIVVRLLDRMRIIGVKDVVIDDAIDQLFPTTLRADLIAAVAEAGLKSHSMALYERWGAPLDYTVDSTMVQTCIKQILHKTISIKKPLGHETSAGSSEDLNASVKQSSSCLLRLVKLFSLRPVNRNFAPSTSTMTEDGTLDLDGALVPHKHIQFAYHVLFQYVDSQPLTLLDRKHFVRLSSAFYLLGQRGAAFKCLGDVMRREESPKLEEAVEFLRLLSQISLEGTINLLIERIAFWKKTNTATEEFKDRDNLSRLYSPLLGKCLQRRDPDLAEKLMTSARANGLEDHVSLRALKGLAWYVFDRQAKMAEPALEIGLSADVRGSDTRNFVSWFEDLMEKDGWRPDPALVRWMIYRVLEVKPVKTEDTELKARRYTAQRADRATAMKLLSLSAKHLGFIDVSSALEVLRAIQHKAYIVREKKRFAPLKQIIVEIDQLVKVVRWVQVLGQKDSVASLDEEDTLPIAPNGQAARVANRLPAHLYRFLIVAYLRANDVLGAANVMIWAREEAGLSFDDLEHGWSGDVKGFKKYLKDIAYQLGKKPNVELAPRDILAMLAGSIPISRTKSWWSRPQKL